MTTIKEHKKYVFFIDKQKFETIETHLNARQILVDFANVNPAENILVLVQGNEMKEYNNPDESIEMKEGMHFTIFSKKPTTVS